MNQKKNEQKGTPDEKRKKLKCRTHEGPSLSRSLSLSLGVSHIILVFQLLILILAQSREIDVRCWKEQSNSDIGWCM